MSSRPVYRYVLRWRHLASAYEVTAGWRLCDRLAPFVLAAYARAKPSLLYLSCVSVLVSAVLRGSLLYVYVYVVQRYDLTDIKRRLLLLLLLLLCSRPGFLEYPNSTHQKSQVSGKIPRKS